MDTTQKPARRRAIILAATVLGATLTACGSGSSGPTISVPVVEFGPASNTDGVLRPNPNGFTFPNFGAAAVSADAFDGADLAAMFGSGPEVCASGSGETCVPTAEAAAWADMVNESRQSGHCEGFIVLALDRFANRTAPDTAQLQTSPGVVHSIFRGFAAQFFDTTRKESRAWRSRSVRDIVAELVTSLKDGVPDYVLGLYGEIGGHAVLPYRVTFPDADSADIGIYDSNWPGQERRVTVDLAAGTWAFSFDGPDPDTDPNAWTGGKGRMDLSSLDAHTTGPCPFCDSATTTTTPTMLSIRASAPTWSLTTSRGTVTPTGEPVAGVDVTKVRAAQQAPLKKSDEWVVTVDPSDIASTRPVKLTLPAGSSATIVTPRAIARAATGPKAAADFTLTPTTVSTTSRSANVQLANGNRKVTADRSATTLTLDDAGTPVNDSSATTVAPVPTTSVSQRATTTTRPAAQATTTLPATSTPSTTSVATTAAPTTSAAPTTTTSPVNFTHSFRNGGTDGYTNSCGMEILDLTVTGASSVSSVTATVGGTAASNAMNSSGNSWTFYGFPSKSPGTYSMVVTVNAANGTRAKTLTIVYDNDCNPNN